jgi:hypothetical protein
MNWDPSLNAWCDCFMMLLPFLVAALSLQELQLLFVSEIPW